jgi:serine/threonine protein kinase/tetratricopeptide (TPR) repeat protein
MTESNNNLENIIKDAVRQYADARLNGEHPEIDEIVKDYPGLEQQIKEGIKNLQKINAIFDTLVQPGEGDFENTSNTPDLVGQKVGNFEIVEMIGRGGMGVVYQAYDTKLKRSVAIKSMPAALTDDSTAQMRFKREAELLASVNHPNIAVIHEIIDQEDAPGYLVLEYVPGETLSDRLKREPFKLEEALSVARQVAEAISAAHEKGIIHRDLKPSNIKLTPDGRVKVLDFGLAKTYVQQDKNQSTAITQPGRIIGTPAYMSPEQARGKATDHRTDIWSFGCIMYQMLTGHLPFDGETATDTLARIIECQPDWELLPNEIPENIRVLLHQCLKKNQDERLGDIGDASIEISETLSSPMTITAAPIRNLRRWVMVIGFVIVAIVVGLNIGRWREQLLGGPGRVESIAVLPLQNLTGDPNQEYFADGMTDSLIASLGKIGALQVRSRTSIMQYKGARKPLPAIARELNVDAVLEGSVMRIGNKVRITAQLIHAQTDTHIWVDSYERDLSDVLTLLSRVARTIANQIEITATPDQEKQLAVNRPINPETYEAYLKGMFHLNKMTPEGTKKGLDYLHQAIEKDPKDPLAYGALALGYAVSGHGPGALPDAFEQAKATALKALELDDTLAEAHAALAINNLYRDWDWETVEHSFRSALKFNPGLTMTRAHYSWYLQLFGRTDEALTQMKRVQELDPLSPLWPAWQGWQYFLAEKYNEAIYEAHKSLELDPDFPIALNVLGSVYAEKGMYEEAIEAFQKAATLSPVWRPRLARTYAKASRRSEARSVLAEVEADPTPWDILFIAEVYAVLGEKDQAFQWLDRAFSPPHHSYIPWIKHFPGFRSLRDDPRYVDLLRRMNLPE